MTSLANDQGIPIEAAIERIRWQSQADVVDTAVRATLGGLYAGLWFDVDNGDRMQVGATVTETRTPSAADVDAAVDAIAAHCGIPGIDVHRQEYSSAELTAAADWLSARAQGNGGVIFTWSLEIVENRVMVQAGPESTRTDAAQAILAEGVDLFGGVVVISEEDPVVAQTAIGTVGHDAPGAVPPPD